MIGRNLHITRRLVFGLITLLCSLGSLADKVQGSELEYFEFEGQHWPLPPYTPERMQQFAHPDDFAVLKGLSMYKPQSGRNHEAMLSGMLQMSSFFLEENIRTSTTALTHAPQLGYRILHDIGSGQNPMEPQSYMAAFAKPLWNNEGRLIDLLVEEATNEDLIALNALHDLKYLTVNSGVEDLDLSLLTDISSIRLLRMGSAFRSFESLCEFTFLSELIIGFSNPKDDTLEINCFPELTTLIYGGNSISSIVLANLPKLEVAGVNSGRLVDFHLAGNSLPNLRLLQIQDLEVTGQAQIEWPENLELMNISRTRIRGGIPALPESLVTLFMDDFFDPVLVDSPLPATLKNLIMKGAADPMLSSLQLPASLTYLDLEGALLDDYSFILNASELESLVLRGSSFEQWELLPKLKNLKHLSLTNTALGDDGLEYLAEMSPLQSLYLSGTHISTLLPLERLQGLNFLSFAETQVIDADQVPYIDRISDLGFGNALYEKYFGVWPEELAGPWPAHIERMMENHIATQTCNGLKPCEIPVFSRLYRSPEIHYSAKD